MFHQVKGTNHGYIPTVVYMQLHWILWSLCQLMPQAAHIINFCISTICCAFWSKNYLMWRRCVRVYEEEAQVVMGHAMSLLPTGETIVYPCNITKVEVCGKVLETKYWLGEQGPLLTISLSKWDCNC